MGDQPATGSLEILVALPSMMVYDRAGLNIPKQSRDNIPEMKALLVFEKGIIRSIEVCAGMNRDLFPGAHARRRTERG
jgi:hypothetical protein